MNRRTKQLAFFLVNAVTSPESDLSVPLELDIKDLKSRLRAVETSCNHCKL